MMHVFLTILIFVLAQESTAFIRQSSSKQHGSTSTSSLDATFSRRDAFLAMASTITTVSTVASNPQLAEAKYADYARREKDWDERKSNKGGVQYSSAKDLRRQLAEMVPANDEGSKIFCPNGASAAVSPLMENKCSDTLMALPSVYGRTLDSTGNSIPGFSTGYARSSGGSSSINSAAVGGFPKYK
mmetsp:Transcript_10967/g.12398  ORF Transcript_10967/g.12398 Transcript_10967/m.12398 type:complete len:186 (+) Transcript_10967:201-758(+)